ncbi:MAG: DUF86 domain-containing protein [Rhizobium sp.]
MSGKGLIYYLDRMQMAAAEARLFAKGMDEAAFAGNRMAQSAVAHSLCVIGAAATQLLKNYPEFEPAHPELRWDELREIGEKLLSDHAGFNAEDLWAAVGYLIPELLTQLESIRRWRAEGE